jgi:hypothetical protein
MTVTERQFVLKMYSREREDLMYEVFLDKGMDIFSKKANFAREFRPLVKHFVF